MNEIRKKQVVCLLSTLNDLYLNAHGGMYLSIEFVGDSILVNAVNRRTRNELLWILCSILGLDVEIVDPTRLKILFS